MYGVRVFVEKIRCIDTESLLSSDRAQFSFAVATDIDKGAQVLPSIRINSGETREFRPPMLLFDGVAEASHVGVAVLGLDLDKNEGWDDSEEARHGAVELIGAALDVIIPELPGVAGLAWTVGMTAIQAGIGEVIKFDKPDIILHDSTIRSLGQAAPYRRDVQDIALRQRITRDIVGYSDSEYEVDLIVDCLWQPAFAPTKPATSSEAMIAAFRQRVDYARGEGFVGAFPNGYYGKHGAYLVGGTILLDEKAAVFRRVTLLELGNPPAGDFAETMRAVQRYAASEGFVGGLPTFQTYSLADQVFQQAGPPPWMAHGKGNPFAKPLKDAPAEHWPLAPKPWQQDRGPAALQGPKVGVILIKREAAEFRDVGVDDLGNPAADDYEARFRAAQDYAKKAGFVGGFPTMFEAAKPTGKVFGHVLLRSGGATWRDVAIGREP